MRKLVESTLVSLDGVIGSPDRWSPFDNEARQLALETLDRSDALLLGRVTYEFFRANWGAATGDPYIDRINAMPKYVASGRSPKRTGTPRCSARTLSARSGG